MGTIKEDYPSLRAAKLRELCILQKRVERVDSAGAILPPGWKDVARLWANVTPFIPRRGGGERVYDEQLKTGTYFRVVMRFRSDVTTTHRLVVVGPPSRALNITGVNDPDSRRRQLVLGCEGGLVDG